MNSIIPILRLVLEQMASYSPNEKVKMFINIALNSSIHLQNVIEDALDITRLENNKFQIFKDVFNVR